MEFSIDEDADANEIYNFGRETIILLNNLKQKVKNVAEYEFSSSEPTDLELDLENNATITKNIANQLSDRENEELMLEISNKEVNSAYAKYAFQMFGIFVMICVIIYISNKTKPIINNSYILGVLLIVSIYFVMLKGKSKL